MEFFCYHRDRAGSLPLRHELLEAHWSYMDPYADRMIARGPTFSGDVLTGSVHIVEVPDAAAARAFAFDEPGYQAGAYRDVLLRRWRNELGRTMWEYPGDPQDGQAFVVLGHGGGSAMGPDVRPSDDRLVAYGPMLSDDGATWIGTAAIVQATDPEAASAILSFERYAEIEVHEWERGGRR